MDVDTSPATGATSAIDAAPTLVPNDGRTGLVALTVDTLRRPRAALPRLAQAPGWRWLWPMLVLALVTAAIGFTRARQPAAVDVAAMSGTDVPPGVVVMGSPVTSAEAAPIAPPSSPVLAVLAAVAALVGVVVGMLLATAVLHLFGTVFGGQQSFGQMLTVVSWAHLPVILGSLLRLAHGLGFGFDASGAGLSGLVENDNVLGPFLAQIELWTLWLVALLFIGMRTVSRVTRGRAVLAVGAVVALWIAVGELGVAGARFASGF